jgi:hypothetical protein
MRKFIIAFALGCLAGLALSQLTGCATTSEELRENATQTLVCQHRCEDWVDAHEYQLFKATPDGAECVCRVMSPNVPDMWDVRVAGK